MTQALLELQVRKDRALRQQLSASPTVQRAVTQFRELGMGRGFGYRRELLADSVRLTRSIAPRVLDAMKEAIAATGCDRPVELYVRQDYLFTATVTQLVAGPLIVVLSSRLVDAFSPAELRFVLGHELGHIVFDHLGIPMPGIASLRSNSALQAKDETAPYVLERRELLPLFVWCRAAELSADRAGLVSAGGLEPAATALFKLASGLSTADARADVAALSAQVDALGTAPAADLAATSDDGLDIYRTHPYSLLRLRALAAFGRSKRFAALFGGDGGLSDDEVEASIDKDLEHMEPTYLQGARHESAVLRRVLTGAMIAVANASGDISPQELAAMSALAGKAELPGRVDAVLQDLERMLEHAKQEPLLRRAQLVQHLAIIAGADGQVSPEERAEMQRIAGRLEVDPTLVDQTVAALATPLD